MARKTINGEKLKPKAVQLYQRHIDFINQHKGDAFNMRIRAVIDKAMDNCAVSAINYATTDDGYLDGLYFLGLWAAGDFEKLKAEYPDAPDSVYPNAKLTWRGPES